MGFDAIDRRFQSREVQLECMRCGHTDGVEMECRRTMYHYEPGEENPNAPVPLCRPCAAEHHAYWDDMWADYNSSRL